MLDAPLAVCPTAHVERFPPVEVDLPEQSFEAVLDGDPEHRDSVLDGADRAAGDVMLICVSRARGPRLVLDL